MLAVHVLAQCLRHAFLDSCRFAAEPARHLAQARPMLNRTAKRPRLKRRAHPGIAYWGHFRPRNALSMGVAMSQRLRFAFAIGHRC